MRLSSIELPGFGCLSGFAAEFGPGLNVFYGENEAGKSTLQQAICAMLYGFYDGERATAAETRRHERFKPWDSSPAGGRAFRGALAYELENGERFEVRRDFSTPDVVTQLIDATLGTDVSALFGRGRHGNVPFARKQLGMPRAVFESCAFISQGEIFELSKNAPAEIGDAIAALADSARHDVSAARALDKLEAVTRRIGRDSARTAELPVARDHLRRANDELAAAGSARRAVAEKSARLEALQARARQLAEQVLRAEYACHAADAARLRDDLRKLDETEALLARAAARCEELAAYRGTPAAARDEVIGLRGQLQRSSEALRRLREARQSLANRLTDEVRLEYETLRLSAGALTEDQVRVLEAAAYRPQAGQDGGSAPQDAGGLWHAIARALSAIGRVFTRVLRAIFRRNRHDDSVGAPLAAPDAVAMAVSPAEAIVLLEKHRRYLTLRPLVDEASRLDADIDGESTSARSIEAQLRSLLRTAGIEDESLASGLGAFDDACQKREQLAKAEAAAQQADARRALLLDGRTREEMAAALAEHESACERLAAITSAGAAFRSPNRAAPAPGKAPSRDGLARALQAARQQKHAAELEAERLETEVRVALDRFRPRAEIEEEAAHWGREVARLEKARAALQLAKSAIEEAMTAVYRDFAPAVNTFLSEGIEAATDGRYRRAHVDPATLRVSLLVPETGLVAQDPPVSHGTRTLLYVLMRIGLAQHMSAIGEPVPLVLDDPFVDVDSRRLGRMLDFLLHLSDRMQVLLFTKDREIVSWFQENAPGSVHRMHTVSTALSASTL
ncbi:MAG TPA: AAA family ATPase [Dehalococcoidia bacterium]|nr:AAA family ATPase [Dehalococcoidia bacterium]